METTTGRVRSCRRWWCGLLAVALVVGAVSAAPADTPPVTEESVETAVQRAVAWLKAQRSAAAHWEPEGSQPDEQFWGGSSALAVLSLLYAGEDPRTPFMESALNWLVSQELRATYTYATRAHALALVRGNRYRSRLESDLKWLLDNVHPAGGPHAGAYDYQSNTSNRADNSNSQFGVLGVWMATDAGLSAPAAYWQLVGDYWMRSQCSDGGWPYQTGEKATGSMTVAGIATMFVVLDRLHGENPRSAAPLIASIDMGLNWLGREYTPENPRGDRQWIYYYLYGVERAGRASGHKYFRNRDWFREGAAYLLGQQQPEGHWRASGSMMMDEVRNTAFALMFLCHGRAPLLFNKLEYGADVAYRLRDVAGLTRFAERALERLLNWQIVTFEAPLDDLLEAPVLYLTGQTAWELEEGQIQKLREYCLRGGMLLAVSGGAAFETSMTRLAEAAFPECRLRPVVSTHPLLSGEVQFAIERPPPLLEVHNGVRTLMLLCTEDIAATWNRGTGPRAHFQLGANVYNYATDKTTFRSRLQTASIPLRQVEIRRRLSVALIRHGGLWNPEPFGWTRLKHYLNNETATRLLVTSGLTLDAPELGEFKIAYLTGRGPLDLSADEQRGLQQFLRGGGTLLADAASGSEEFRKSLESLVTAALRGEPARLRPDSPVLTGSGIPDAVDLVAVGYTRTTRGPAGEKYPPLWAYDVGQRLAVIYCPLDLSTGLLGTPIYNRRGLDGPGCLRTLRNMLLYADLPAREKSRLSRQ